MEFFVSTSGNDSEDGTRDRPFRTVNRGVRALGAGDVLNLRHGIHVGSVSITGKHGTPNAPIVIQSFPGEHAYIDGTVPQFRRRHNEDWIPARSLDAAAADEEFISAVSFDSDPVNRGAFLDRNPYTRLVTYSNLNDLRADNETFEQIFGEDPREGPVVTDEDGNPLGHRRPWVYMGPGIHFNRGTRRIHVRLSHTHNNVPGVIDYTDEVDPRLVPLAISARGMTALRIGGSSHLRLERLTISYGGEDSILIERTQNLTFDHVRIRAATRGIRMGGPPEDATADVEFAHCRFHGGVPPWFFRTDRKAVYHFVDADSDQVVPNNLGESTSDRLLLGNPNNTDVEIHHCEFLNGHDVFLEGKRVDFHHNWINNLQDDGLAVGFDQTAAGPFNVTKIHQNVFTRTLTGFSFASRNQTTRWRIYRNLIDLRGRTRKFRPRHEGDTDVFRHGQLHKSTGDALGPHDLFQNTILTFDQREQASFLHYRSATGPHRRRSFNNVFVAVNPVPAADRAIGFVPPPTFPGPTDGNLYHRMGLASSDLLRHLAYRFDGEDFPGGFFEDLDALRASALFEQSKTQYPPGYELDSHEADPQFRGIGADGRFREDDDLRLSDRSPGIGAGIPLPDDLRDLDPFPVEGRPDVGCYPADAGPLRVGVDACRSFPRAPRLSVTRPRRFGGGVWKPVFVHEFLDGDPANLKAVPGELTVLPDGPLIEPTPEPEERGMLMAPGNRLLGYRFAEPFEDVIGIDLSVDILYPPPNPFSPFVFPLVSLGDGAGRLAVGRLFAPEGPPTEPMPAAIHFNVAGDTMASGEVSLPPFSLMRTTRFRARWHTRGQAHIWHEGVLRAYEPGLATGGSVAVDQLVVGIPAEVPKFSPRYRIRRVYLKLLRRDDARHGVDGQVPIDVSCVPANDCAEQVRALQEELLTRTRGFMTGVVAKLTSSWREGQPSGPFTPEAVAAHGAAVGAAEAFGEFLESGEDAAADASLQRIGQFFDILAATDPAGFGAVVSDLEERAAALDPACARTLESVHAANQEALEPLALLLQAMWQRALTALRGEPRG